MSQYFACVYWQRSNHEPFTDQKYSRGHEWEFDGGIKVPASSSPHVVRLPYSDEAAVDPEEAFVAALSSCHMLFFLSHAASAGYVLNRYRDEAVGTMAKNEQGQMAMTQVILKPQLEFEGEPPSLSELQRLHHKSHEDCFIANSVHTRVTVEIIESQ